MSPLVCAIQRHVQADDIGGGSHVGGRVLARDAELARDVVGEAAAPRHHGQAEGSRARGDFAADLSQADQPEGAPEEAARLGEAALVPLPLAQRDDVVGDLAVQRQNQAEGQFGHGHRVLAGTVGDVDAAPRSGRHVDGVVAGAGAHHEFERAGGEHRLRHFGGTHHQHVGAELLHFGDQRIVLELGSEADFASHGLRARRGRTVRIRRRSVRAWRQTRYSSARHVLMACLMSLGARFSLAARRARAHELARRKRSAGRQSGARRGAGPAACRS